MSPEAVLTVASLLLVLVGLALELSSADVLLMAALALVTVAGVIDPETALTGFANTTLLALGSLYVVAAAIRETGILDRVSTLLLGSRQHLPQVLGRLAITSAVASAFLNNTPIVAMGIPAVRSWARRHGVSASRLLMPLSYASILGGLCTLIGTSTNLVTDGLLRSSGFEGLGFFELAWIGVPCLLVGVLYLVFLSPHLLREREGVRSIEERERRALMELELDEDADLVGRTVEAAGLEKLPGLTLARIDRGEQAIAPVDSDEELAGGDRLFYEADADAPVRPPELTDYPGLRLALKPMEHEEVHRDRELHSAVVKEGSRLVGSTVGEAEFLERFNVAVTGVRRDGERLHGPLGEIVLRPGDILMLDTGRGFREAFEDSPEFVVTSEVGGERPVQPMPDRGEASPVRRIGAVAILIGIVVLAATGALHIAVAALVGALVFVGLGFLSPGEARQSIDWEVLIVIGAALGLGRAMDESGAAEIIGHGLVEAAAGHGELGLLAGVVLAAMILTGLITNNAAAALMFPIALSIAQEQAVDPRPLFIGITVASSLALWTPLGYQTNLMVYGPGNYRFSDFLRLGLPLQLLLAVVIVAGIPLVWSF
jgi:di/tricarboxylate transporter